MVRSLFKRRYKNSWKRSFLLRTHRCRSIEMPSILGSQLNLRQSFALADKTRIDSLDDGVVVALEAKDDKDLLP